MEILKLSDSNHVRVALVQGEPEELAMAQALYSRAKDSVIDMVEQQTHSPEALKDKLRRYYLGYGHGSIANCASTTLFIENIPMLDAFIIQMHPLYRGQEKSSRYCFMVDDATDAAIDAMVERAWENHLKPLALAADADGASLQELMQEQMQVYVSVYRDRLQAYSETLPPAAARPKAADVARGWLPLWTPTSLSLHVDLQTAYLLLTSLMTYSGSVAKTACRCYDLLQMHYPDAFPALTLTDERVQRAAFAAPVFHAPSSEEVCRVDTRFTEVAGDTMDAVASTAGSPAVDFTKMDTRYPALDLLGHVSVSGALDFGALRDLNRHRSLHRSIALPRQSVVGAWYLNQMKGSRVGPRYFNAAALSLPNDAPATPAFQPRLDTYFARLGTPTDFCVSGPLGAMLYTLFLRAKPTVHPTLRAAALDALDQLADSAAVSKPGYTWLRRKLFSGIESLLQQNMDYTRRANADIKNADGESVSTAGL